MSDTTLIDSPANAEMDTFLDEAIGSAADETDDSSASEYGNESDFTTDEQDSDEEFDDAALDEDEDAIDEDDEPDSSDPDVGEDDPRLTAAERRAQEAEYALEQERAAIRAEVQRLQQMQKAATAVTRLNEMRARMTDEEWVVARDKFVKGFEQQESQQKDAIIQQLVQERAYAEFHAAESAAHDAIMDHVRDKFTERGWTMTDLEEDVLLSQPNGEAFKPALERLIARREAQIAKGKQTKAKNLRDTRRASGADNGSVRGTGGARGITKTYDNFNPDNFDEYWDDVNQSAASR